MWLLAVFVVAPIVELYVIIQTGQAIGGWNTIGLLILIGIVGSWVIKREGLKVWNRFVQQTQAGQVPSREIADGVCILLAGALLLAPGFIGDVAALLLVFPPTRAVFRAWLLRRKRFGRFGRGPVITATYGGPMGDTTGGRRVSSDGVTDATATDISGELDP